MKNDSKVIIITGAGTGVGSACAIELARSGANILINYSKSEAGAYETEKHCKKEGVDAVCVPGNVEEDQACKNIVRTAIDRWGRVDGLVNNAGITKFVPAHDLDGLTAEDFISMYSVNVIGAYQMIRACAPHLKETGGSIVNMSSIAGVKSIGSSTAYIASKAALNAMTVALARALAPEIKINAICPALIDTEWHSKRFDPEKYEQFLEKYRSTVPLKAAASPRDIAELTRWLLTENKLITGESILIDGGLHLGKQM